MSNTMNVEDKLKQKDIVIEELMIKLKEYEKENESYKNYLSKSHRSPTTAATAVTHTNDDNASISVICDNDEFNYVYVDAISVCAKIESYLKEMYNELDQNERKNECVAGLLRKLFNLVIGQTKDSKECEQLRNKLLQKIESIDCDRCKIFQSKLEAYEATLDCKKLVDNKELSALNEEILKWKTEMKYLNKKLGEQTKLISVLVTKCEEMKSIESASVGDGDDDTTIENHVDDATSFCDITNSVDASQSSTLLGDLNNNDCKMKLDQLRSFNGTGAGASAAAAAPVAINNQLVTSTPNVNEIETNNNKNRKQYDYIEFNANSDDAISFEDLSLAFRTVNSELLGNRQHRRQNNENEQQQHQQQIVQNIEQQAAQAQIPQIPAFAQAPPRELVVEHKPLIKSNSDTLLILQCPTCNLIAPNNFDFNRFQQHAELCDVSKSPCMFCLDLFSNNQDLDRHIQDKHENELN